MHSNKWSLSSTMHFVLLTATCIRSPQSIYTTRTSGSVSVILGYMSFKPAKWILTMRFTLRRIDIIIRARIIQMLPSLHFTWSCSLCSSNAHPWTARGQLKGWCELLLKTKYTNTVWAQGSALSTVDFHPVLITVRSSSDDSLMPKPHTVQPLQCRHQKIAALFQRCPVLALTECTLLLLLYHY